MLYCTSEAVASRYCPSTGNSIPLEPLHLLPPNWRFGIPLFLIEGDFHA